MCRGVIVSACLTLAIFLRAGVAGAQATNLQDFTGQRPPADAQAPPPVQAPAQPAPAPPSAYPPRAYPAAQPRPTYGGYLGQPTWQPPLVLPYREGQPIPVGYHLSENPRQGLVTAGYIMTLIPWGLGTLIATGANFRNESVWLTVPIVGPWLTMGRREYNGCQNEDDGLGCLGDIFTTMGLILNGAVQAGGGTMLLVGNVATKKELVRNDMAMGLVPSRVGSGYGVRAFGAF